MNFQIFKGLVQYEDKTKLVPALATGWSNPDSSTWVFDIRPNVKFHTGRVMTAEDVTPSRVRSNIDIFDFELSDDEMKQIDGLNQNKRIGPDPDKF